MKPYYGPHAGITIYHGDCREILPGLPDKSVDVVCADPPYGIGKAQWDNSFCLDWMESAARIAFRIGLMPGTWNLLSCPQSVGDLSYRWTLAAHLQNGMTRGAMGFGNWIPCVVYSVDYSSTKYRQKVLEWCRKFGDWCRSQKIKNQQLDEACGTSSMGDWWTGRSLPWVQIPSVTHWQEIKAKFPVPPEFDAMPEAADYCPVGDCKDFTVGKEPKPDHETPKPLEVVTWFLKSLGGDSVLDPFLGSGTTLVAAKKLGKQAIGIEIEERYCEIAAKRLSQEVLQFSGTELAGNLSGK
jgi:DNA modification methylase